MRFWPFRTELGPRGLRIVEGLYSWIWAASPYEARLGITSVLFFTPNASPAFVFTSLPVLLRLSRDLPTTAFLLRAGSVLAMSGTLKSMTTVLPLLDNRAEVIAGQSLLSLGQSAAAVLPAWGHQQVVRWQGMEEGWETDLLFGLMWSVAWEVWGALSPFGSYYKLNRPGLTITFPRAPTGPDTPLPMDGCHRYQCLPGYDGLSTVSTRWHLRSGSVNPARPVEGGAGGARLELIEEGQGAQPDGQTAVLLRGGDGTRQVLVADSTPLQAKALAPNIRNLATAFSVIYIFLLAQSTPDTISLSFPVADFTPLTLGCVLPVPSKLSPINNLVAAIVKVGSSARIIVTPESASRVHSAKDREEAIDKIRTRVCAQYGDWVVLGIETTMYEHQLASEEDGPDEADKADTVEVAVSWKTSVPRKASSMAQEPMGGGVNSSRDGRTTVKRNEAVLIGPEGELRSYEKQKLVPLVESYPMTRGHAPIPVWDIALPCPPHLNKTDWTPSLPHVRPIGVSPLICLDTFHHGLLPSSGILPDFLVIPAISPSPKLAEQLVGHVQTLAATHGVPALICAASSRRSGEGISALVDGTGIIRYRQRGGTSFSVSEALPYRGEGVRRRAAASEFLGCTGVIGLGALALAASQGYRRWVVAEGHQNNERRTEDGGEELESVRGKVQSSEGTLERRHKRRAWHRSTSTLDIKRGRSTQSSAPSVRQSGSVMLSNNKNGGMSDSDSDEEAPAMPPSSSMSNLEDANPLVGLSSVAPSSPSTADRTAWQGVDHSSCSSRRALGVSDGQVPSSEASLLS